MPIKKGIFTGCGYEFVAEGTQRKVRVILLLHVLYMFMFDKQHMFEDSNMCTYCSWSYCSYGKTFFNE